MLSNCVCGHEGLYHNGVGGACNKCPCFKLRYVAEAPKAIPDLFVSDGNFPQFPWPRWARVINNAIDACPIPEMRADWILMSYPMRSEAVQ